MNQDNFIMFNYRPQLLRSELYVVRIDSVTSSIIN